MLARIASPYRLGAQIGFGPHDAGTTFLASGWSAPEEAGFTWSDGPEAVLRFAIATPARDVACTLELMPFTLPGPLDQQRVEFFFNFFRVGYAELAGGRREVTLDLPREIFMLRTAVLTLHIPTCRSPAELDLSPDRRRLGVALWSFRIAPAQ